MDFETFHIDEFVDLVFISDELVSSTAVEIFSITQSLPASILGLIKEPFSNIKGTSLKFSVNGGDDIIILFTEELTNAIEVSSFINNASGVSGLTASDKNGFLLLETNEVGPLSSLESKVENNPLGISIETVFGKDQTKNPVSIDFDFNLFSLNQYTVTFKINEEDFKVNEIYFIVFDDGVSTQIRKIRIKSKNDFLSVNFVS